MVFEGVSEFIWTADYTRAIWADNIDLLSERLAEVQITAAELTAALAAVKLY